MTMRIPLLTQALAALLLVATALPAVAASNICDFRGYSDDKDPAGTNVRSGPGTDHEIIGVLKAVDDGSGYGWSPEFPVRAFKDGWFQIGDARIEDYGDVPPDKVFTGPGWVSSKLVLFDIEDPLLRDGPSLDAATVLDMNSLYDPANAWNLADIRLQTVHACEGPFLEVTVINPTGQTKRGWITDLCANQATTCS